MVKLQKQTMKTTKNVYLLISEILLYDKSTKLRNFRSEMPLMSLMRLYAAVRNLRLIRNANPSRFSI